MSDNHIKKIEDGAVAMRLYQNGDSISDSQLDDAIYFCDAVHAVSKHPDFRVGRFYNTYRETLAQIKQLRQEDKKKNK
jgi:hypothetical protein